VSSLSKSVAIVASTSTRNLRGVCDDSSAHTQKKKNCKHHVPSHTEEQNRICDGLPHTMTASPRRQFPQKLFNVLPIHRSHVLLVFASDIANSDEGLISYSGKSAPVRKAVTRVILAIVDIGIRERVGHDRNRTFKPILRSHNKGPAGSPTGEA
jgi:hypothetical protein